QELTGNGGDDIGIVDFVRLSFALFGFNLLSFYLAYFSLLAVSLACAVYAFRKQPGALAVFFVLALSLPLLFASSLFDPKIDGVLDPRFLSTLCIIPGVHIALATLSKIPWTRSHVTLVVLQSLLLVFGYWIRSSALWVVLALLVLAAFLVLRALRISGKRNLRTLWPEVWPVGVVAGMAVVHLLYVALALHPVYRSA